jgi:hypothetical protein
MEDGRRTDGHITKLIVAFRKCSNAPNTPVWVQRPSVVANVAADLLETRGSIMVRQTYP